MPQWIDLGPVADLPDSPQQDHACRTVEVDGKPLSVIVFPLDGGGHRVMANVCPHAGLPLGDGERRGLTITCPYHGYTYRITDGQDLDDPDFGEPATVYPTRVENDTLQIDIQPPEK
jgi:nitrite reductase (NADH) small subunit